MGDKKMKLCFIAKPESIHTRRWLSWFAAKGHDVHLIGIGPMPQPIANVKVEILFPYYSLRNPLFWLRIFKVRSIINKIQPDIVHAHFVDDCGWLALLSGFHPYAVTIWGSDLRLLPDKSTTGFGKYLTKKTLRNADLVTAVNSELRDKSISMGSKPDRTHKIIWGIDLNRFNKNVNTAELKTKLSLENSFIILSPRNLTKLYNIETIIRSIPRIVKTVPNVKYIFLGEGNLEVELKNLSRSLGVEKNVIFTGNVSYDEIPKYYGLADICVSVSTSDGTPSSMLEAMACGLPLILSDLPPYHEWVENDKNCLYVPAFDVNALAGATLSLFNNSSLRLKMGNENLLKIKENADQEKCLLEMENLYKGMLK